MFSSTLLLLGLTVALAQESPGSSGTDEVLDALTDGAVAEMVSVPADPWTAFAEGDYVGALHGFVSRQVERPHDAATLLNVGSAQYKVGDFDAAASTFARAAALAEPDQRATARYNQGNTAFRQGKLEDAVEHYTAVLDMNPDDVDAKFNVEFVRNEIRRRHEESKDRQEPGEDGEPGDDSQEGEDQEPGDDSQEGDDSQQGDDPQEQDSDGDGLSDQTEENGENPTDPNNADSDGDGIPDGEEDENHNGQRDDGETDPNNPDSDGDGQPDAADPSPNDDQQPGEAPQPAGAADEMTEDEAERHLQSLQEGRLDPSRRGDGEGVPVPAGKDW